MSEKLDHSRFAVISKKILEIVNKGIELIDYIISKRIYINILIIILSAGLITGVCFSNNDKDYLENTYKTLTSQTKDKFKLIGINFISKTQNRLDRTIQIAYSNGKEAVTKKSFHHLPNLKIKSKNDIVQIFTKKSFNTIDNSKKLRLGELKWKLFSKIQ